MEKQVALVTGGNRGVGFEVCRQLADKGYFVLLSGRDETKGKEAVAKLKRSNVHFLLMDVADKDSIEQAAESIASDYGRLDILINNAAILYDSWQKAHSADMRQVHDAIHTNLLGPWTLCRKVIPMMEKQGWGRIVNVSSESGSMKSMAGNTPAYSVTKAALNALTINLAAGLQGSGILVNSVCPGWVRTDMGGSSAPRSVEEGASSVLWAATLPDEGPSGGFFRDGKPIPF
ncbi:SDR family oxidoreductase [Roseivirga sp. BDSF3-8]|uniref:SDR family oxidoreductase n=1 Tax=Roseivirga sp. BDSF3-8 TaxID=3241598 RepID=UPI003531AFCC